MAGGDVGWQVDWKNIGGGTGAMLRQLANGDLDLAVTLTEGALAHIIRDPEKQLAVVAPFVASPLCWAILTGGSNTRARAVADLEGPIGVSRMGSGSHLMSFLLAEREGWGAREQSFVPLGDFQGLRRGVNESFQCEFFLWEKFMTMPYVDAGELRRVGEITTLWPCFVVCARRSWLAQSNHRELTRKALGAVRAECRRFVDDFDQSVTDISASFMLSEENAAAWLRQVRYAGESVIRRSVLEETWEALHRVGVVDSAPESPEEIDLLVDGELVSLLDREPEVIGAASDTALRSPHPHYQLGSVSRHRTRLSGRSRAMSGAERDAAEAAPVVVGGLRFASKSDYESWQAGKKDALRRVVDHLNRFGRADIRKEGEEEKDA